MRRGPTAWWSVRRGGGGGSSCVSSPRLQLLEAGHRRGPERELRALETRRRLGARDAQGHGGGAPEGGASEGSHGERVPRCGERKCMVDCRVVRAQ